MPLLSKPSQSHSPSILFAKGFSMGVADVIPGISGGTIALVLGIYRELIDTIKGIKLRQIKILLKNGCIFWKKSSHIPIRLTASEMNLPFLLPLVCGIASAILVASYILPPLLKAYPMQMDSLFFGLVLASIAIPLSMIPKKTITIWGIITFFAWVAYLLVSLPVLQMNGSLYFTFFSGAIAICAMILPGISGSYLLQTLGQYEYILQGLHQALEGSMNAWVIVLVFVVGMILGITSFARILSWTFHYYSSQTLAVLTGMMLGALKAIWPFQDEATQTMILPTSFGQSELICLLLFLTGIFITTLLFMIDRRLGKAGHG